MQLSSYADPIMERLDPQHIIQYRLYRGETYYKDGKHLRDLSKLNRDLSKVVMVTTDPDVVSLQSENGVIVSPSCLCSHRHLQKTWWLCMYVDFGVCELFLLLYTFTILPEKEKQLDM